MSRRSNQKLKLLYLSKILNDMTDERHGMTLTEILAELSKYGIETGRKSLYDDLEALRVYGFDVCSRRDRYVRYYIGKRKLDRAEIKLLSDLVSTSPVLGDARASELIKKIWNNEYMSGMLPPERGETFGIEGDVYKNAEAICDAIVFDKAITFKYFEWNAHRQRILCREGQRITFSPFYLKMRQGRYVVIGIDHANGEPAEFLLQRMLSIAQSGKRCKTPPTEIFTEEEPTNVRLSCQNAMASYVFDKFGTGVTVLSNNEECFEVSVKTALDEAFLSWVFLSGGGVRILSPDWALERFTELAKKVSKI